MSRSRYWKLTSDEVKSLTHDPDKVLNWEIKCVKEPEEEAKFIGVFLYRHGTPYDYESKKGIVYYHNNIERSDLPEITKFIQKRFGGEKIEKGERIFLEGSKEIYTGKEIADLANALNEKFHTKSIISMELDDVTQDELKGWGYPDSKLLPIPGK
tara:strand:+ start:365 stop:829 length:465 start_codon:yes stop_codon:yes gene_type:complete